MGEKTVTLRKLIVQALPEFGAFQAVTGIITLIAGELIRWLVGIVLHTKIAAITSSNIKDVLLGWQADLSGLWAQQKKGDMIMCEFEGICIYEDCDECDKEHPERCLIYLELIDEV